MTTYQVGQRVRVIVNMTPLWEGAWYAPAGTPGTITDVFAHGNYGVLVDGDPDAMPLSMKTDELTAL